MSLNTKTTLVSATYRCDKRDCPESLTVGSDEAPLGGSSFFDSKEMRHVKQTAKDRGWSRWIHQRGVKYYCAGHGPAKPSNMHKDW